jgi:hypothetical protein
MNYQKLIIWISLVGVIGIVFGVFYAFFGLKSLPVYQKFVPDAVYTPWSNGLYGSVFIGFSVLLFFVGRYAFQQKNKVLMKALLYGIMSWLIVEALFSLYYEIYINVGVDMALAIFLGLPLLVGIRRKSEEIHRKP